VSSDLPEGFTLDATPSAELPDGFTADPLHQTAGPSGSLSTDSGRIAGTVGANVLGGLLSLPRTVAQGVDYLGNHVPGVVGGPYNIGADKALGSVKDQNDRQVFPDYPTAREMAFNTEGSAGPAVGGSSAPATEYQPQSYLGRRGMDAATAATYGLLSGGVGAVIPSAVGGVTGGAASEALPDHPFIAGMAGFIPGAGLGSLASKGTQGVVQAVTNGAKTEPYGAFTRLGLPTDLSGTVTGDSTLQAAQKAAGSMADRKAGLMTAWQDKLNDVADNMGKAVTPQDVGTSLQTHAQNWLSNWKNQTGNLWNDFNAKMPPATPVGTANYRAALDKANGNFQGAPASGGALQSSTLKNLSDALTTDLAGGSTLPVESLQNIRTAIGEKLSNPQIVGDTSQGALKTIYGGLTRDLAQGANSVSPDAANAFKAATEATKTGHALIDQHLGPILNATTPEAAAAYALQQAQRGGTRLSAITTALPGATGDLGSFALRNLAGNTDSPTAFSTALSGRRPILSPEAQSVLFPQAVQQDIADLGTTAGKIKSFENDLAKSGADHSTGRLVGAMEGAKMGHEIGGITGGIAGGVGGYVAGGVNPGGLLKLAMRPATSSLFGRQIPLPPTKLPFVPRSAFVSTLGDGIPTTTPGSSQPSQ
jgi:hypothetical protein